MHSTSAAHAETPSDHSVSSRRSFLAASALFGAAFLSPLRTLAADTAVKPGTVSPAVPGTATAPPQRVTLTCAENMATGVNVTWRSAASVEAPQAQLARLTATPKFQESAQKVVAEPFSFQSRPGETAFQYNLRFTDLAPDTQYCFRVGDGQSWSEWCAFQTAADTPKPFSFLYFGDVQNEIRALCSRAVRAAYRHAPNARFVVCAGDLVTEGCNDGLWGEFSDAFGFVASSVPCLPTPGNHDTKRPENEPDPEAPYTAAPAYHGHFNFPKNGPRGAQILNGEAYFVDCQGVRVISLNSNVFDDDKPANAAHRQAWDAQLAWLEETLANNPNRWTVVTHHHPIYSMGKNRDNVVLRGLLRPLYDKYRVDLVLQGHDHSYGRTHKLAGDAVVAPDAPGTVYAVSVFGPKMYESKPKFRELMAVVDHDKQLFQVINVAGDTLSYESRGIDGSLVDAFSLRKDASGASTLLPSQAV